MSAEEAACCDRSGAEGAGETTAGLAGSTNARRRVAPAERRVELIDPDDADPLSVLSRLVDEPECAAPPRRSTCGSCAEGKARRTLHAKLCQNLLLLGYCPVGHDRPRRRRSVCVRLDEHLALLRRASEEAPVLLQSLDELNVLAAALQAVLLAQREELLALERVERGVVGENRLGRVHRGAWVGLDRALASCTLSAS